MNRYGKSSRELLGGIGAIGGLTTALLVLSSCVAIGQDAPDPRVELDIPFVPGGGHEQQLDLYVPAQDGFPTLLFAHEGSLTSGDRKDEPYAQMCRTFVSLGIGCVNTNYRLAPASKWPAQPDDVAAAFRWVKENIGSRGGAPDEIYLFGHSSGCTLVSIVAADPSYLAKQDLEPEDIAGVIAMGCRLADHIEVTSTPPPQYEMSFIPPDRVNDFPKVEDRYVSLQQRNDAVPAKHVSERLPPTLVVIAEEERFFPPILRDAAEFVGRALVHDVEADLVILADRRHMTAIRNMVTPDDQGVVEVVNFIRSRRDGDTR